MTQKKINISEKDFNPKKHVKEIKCKCNQCGKIWHYLDSDVRKLAFGQGMNACVSLTQCGCIPLQAYFLNKAKEVEEKRKQLERCPKCGSRNITKKAIYYEKQK